MLWNIKRALVEYTENNKTASRWKFILAKLCIKQLRYDEPDVPDDHLAAASPICRFLGEDACA